MMARARRMKGKPRARELGIPFGGRTGRYNAITDVHGIEVGHCTIISGSRKAVRTGVTAVHPRGRDNHAPVFAGWFSQNGNGEMTGTAWIEESGFLAGPVMITNTHSVGIVRDTVIEWLVKTGSSGQPWALPVVAETWDGWLNDINGFHVGRQHVFDALNTAHDGPVAEGNVGGGTGMIGYGFKGGIGTASRVIDVNQNSYVLGTIVQLNCGRREELTVAGVPVGRKLLSGDISACEKGSIVVVVATDAPLLPHQLKRLARRATMGLARTGSVSGNFSGDIFLAFSTANLDIATKTAEIQSKFLSGNSLKSHMCLEAVLLPNEAMDPLFTATVESTEEAIINALIAAETMVGIDGHRLTAIPHKDLCQILNSYGRLCLSPNES